MFKHFYQFPAVLAMCLAATSGVADQAPNPRSAVSANTNTARNSSAKVMTRGDGTAASVVSRGGATSARATQNNVSARSAATKTTVARTGRTTAVKSGNMANRSATVSRSASTPARAGTVTKANLGRSAVPGMKNNARSASKTISNLGMARAANMARATAVFNDISKIGGGYSQCRDSYATCMDQFCANANDTFRRCYCSQKFSEFQETEAMFEEVKGLLQSFEDNDLNAVDKTAAEVNAMYTATVGEAAIKKDVSGAAEKLSSIADLLSGKKKPGQQEQQNKSTGLDISSLSTGFTIDMNDLWGGSSNSLFGGAEETNAPNMAEMSGKQLYNEANRQCVEITKESCSSTAIFNMATSSYSLMINQDCNLYEKKLDTQRQAIMNTVREAEKMLRNARLEEYRAHNSADVNECLSKVRSAMLQDTACGASYKRCLDYSGQYINQTSGEPIYSPLLFKLTEMINLYAGNTGTESNADAFGDVLTNNGEFDKFLEAKKLFATTALDSCRDIADTVWTEFKRSAIIEIAQAQDEKIEEVKSSCVSTMGECYDSQSGELKNFDNTSAKSTGAIAANAARAMCSDKVAACAALYGNGEGCVFDKQGRITNATSCGLGALLDFVATVDSTKIAEGCADAMAKYAQELCAPVSGATNKYPWGCRSMARHDVEKALLDRAAVYCDVSGTADSNLSSELLNYSKVVSNLTDSIAEELSMLLMTECEKADGVWIESYNLGVKNGENYTREVNIKQTIEDNNATTETKKHNIAEYGFNAMNGAEYKDEKQLAKFLSAIGVNETVGKNDVITYGLCMENSVKAQCDIIAGEDNKYAKYNDKTGMCVLNEPWYQEKCDAIGGYYENDICYYPGE